MIKSYLFTDRTTSSSIHWGLGAVLSDAEGSTGQTPSSEKWREIVKALNNEE
jgi:hypothetical protein